MQPLDSILRDQFLSGVVASLVAAVLYESILKRINYKMLLNIFVSIMKAFRILLNIFVFGMKSFYIFMRGRFTQVKPILGRIRTRYIGYAILSVTLLVGGFQAVRYTMIEYAQIEKAEAAAQLRLQEKQKAEQQRLQREKEQAKAEQERIADAKWKKFSREHSNNYDEYRLIYKSRVWIPWVVFFLAIYILGNGAYFFTAIGKAIAISIFVLSIALLSPRFLPELANWSSLTLLKLKFDELVRVINLPGDPVIWLGGSFLAGFLVETLARVSRK